MRKSLEAPICAPLVLMAAPPAVLAVDIETHDWREKWYQPAATEEDQEEELISARLDEAASKCNAQAGPCTTCRIRALQTVAWGQHTARGQFGHFTVNKPWELTYSRVVQLGYVVSDAEGNILERFEHCISDVPGGCSAKATNYHGLTDEQLTREGIPIAEAMKQFGAELRKLDAAGGKLIAHHLEFDAGILRAELELLGDEFAGTTALLRSLAKDGVCTLEWAKNYLVGVGKLDTACEPFGIDTTSTMRHTAVYDAEVAATLYSRMKEARGGLMTHGWLMTPVW